MRSDTQLWTRHEMDMGEGMPEEVFHMPATPEEIKEAHGRCLTCKHRINYHCNNPDSFAYQQVFPQPSMTYCNHHEPKEL